MSIAQDQNFDSPLLNHPFISSRYFFPRKVEFSHPFKVKVNGAELACYYSKPFETAKTIVHFHGNGEVVSDYFNDFSQAVHNLGYNIFYAEYRGYGMSSGTPEMATMLQDAEIIIDAIKEPLENLVLFGRSVGSIYALHAAAAYPQISGLVIESGIASPLDRILMRVNPAELDCKLENLESESKRLFNHAKKIKTYRKPLLIMHTKEDGIVDIKNARQLYDWSESQQKDLIIFDYGDHNSIFYSNFNSYFKSLEAFLRSL